MSSPPAGERRFEHRSQAARRSPPRATRRGPRSRDAPSGCRFRAAASRSRRLPAAAGSSRGWPCRSSPSRSSRCTMPRVAGTSRRELRDRLGQQLVGRRVVGLSGVAEAPGDRGEEHRRADRRRTERGENVEPAVGLDVEDEIELLLGLVGESLADLDAGGVEQHVDPSTLRRAAVPRAAATASSSRRSTWW